MFPCDLCEYIGTEIGLQHHKLAHHSIDKHPCKLCDFTASSINKLTVHQELMHKDVQYHCDQCEFAVSSEAQLMRHTKVKHSNEHFPCLECDFVTTQARFLRKHIETRHSSFIYYCEECDYSASRPNILKGHMNVVHKGIGHKCDQCEYIGYRALNLKHHKESRHENVRYPCNECSHSATSASNLKAHEETQHQKNVYPCNVCDHAATTLSKLKRHKLFIHKDKLYACNLCGHKAPNPKLLQIHVKKRHETLRFPCDQCDHVAAIKRELKDHKKIKHIQDHPCDYPACDFTTKNPHYLKVHKRSKHEALEFRCDLCGYVATIKSNLHRHIKCKHNKADTDGYRWPMKKKTKEKLKKLKAKLKDSSILNKENDKIILRKKVVFKVDVKYKMARIIVKKLDYNEYLKFQSKSLDVIHPVFIEACDFYAASNDIKEETGEEDPLAVTTKNHQTYNTLKISECDMKSEIETDNEISIKEELLDNKHDYFDMNPTGKLDSAIKDRLNNLPGISCYKI